MRRFDWCCLVLIAVLSALHAGGEWLADAYQRNLQAQRSAHHFDRALIISGEQTARMAVGAAGQGAPAADVPGASVDATRFLSADSLSWLEHRSFVASVHPWSVQGWEMRSPAGESWPISIYGIGAEDITAFRLGAPDALEDGALVLAESSRKGLDTVTADIALNVPAQILAQLPAETAALARQSGGTVLPLSSHSLADPPGLRPGRRVAYVDRDGDQLGGMLKPAALYVVLLQPGTDVADAKAEIDAYLSGFEQTSALGVRPVVRAVDEYFPPILSDAEIGRWLAGLRAVLVALYLLVGLGAAWLKLREQNVEMAVRTAVGATPAQAFAAVQGRWLGALALASLAGALPVSLAALVTAQGQHLPAAVGVLALAVLALLLGTLWVARRALRQEPLRILAGENG